MGSHILTEQRRRSSPALRCQCWNVPSDHFCVAHLARSDVVGRSRVHRGGVHGSAVCGGLSQTVWFAPTLGCYGPIQFGGPLHELWRRVFATAAGRETLGRPLFRCRVALPQSATSVSPPSGRRAVLRTERHSSMEPSHHLELPLSKEPPRKVNGDRKGRPHCEPWWRGPRWRSGPLPQREGPRRRRIPPARCWCPAAPSGVARQERRRAASHWGGGWEELLTAGEASGRRPRPSPVPSRTEPLLLTREKLLDVLAAELGTFHDSMADAREHFLEPGADLTLADLLGALARPVWSPGPPWFCRRRRPSRRREPGPRGIRERTTPSEVSVSRRTSVSALGSQIHATTSLVPRRDDPMPATV